MSDSALFRKSARQALRGNWQTALLITFSAGIFGIISNVIQMRFNLQLTPSADLIKIFSEGRRQFSGFQGLFLLLFILDFVFSSALAIGLNYYYLQLHRGREAVYSLLFSRIHILGKCLGQSLLISLYTLGWGAVVFVPFLLIAFLLHGMNYVLAVIFIIGLACLLMIITYRYAMAPYLMADHPEMGVMESIRESKRMMNGQAGRLFGLQLSLIGWGFLAAGITAGLRYISPVFGTVIGLLCSLILQVYINAAFTAFYLDFLNE